MATKDDGMEGGADPCGAPGGGPDVRLGNYDGDGDGDAGGDYGGAAGMNPPFPMPAGTSTANEPPLTC